MQFSYRFRPNAPKLDEQRWMGVINSELFEVLYQIENQMRVVLRREKIECEELCFHIEPEPVGDYLGIKFGAILSSKDPRERSEEILIGEGKPIHFPFSEIRAKGELTEKDVSDIIRGWCSWFASDIARDGLPKSVLKGIAGLKKKVCSKPSGA